MTRPFYGIDIDPYVMEGFVYVDPKGNMSKQKDVAFGFSIRRSDGSLVFRAKTLRDAERLLSNLMESYVAVLGEAA